MAGIEQYLQGFSPLSVLTGQAMGGAEAQPQTAPMAQPQAQPAQSGGMFDHVSTGQLMAMSTLLAGNDPNAYARVAQMLGSGSQNPASRYIRVGHSIWDPVTQTEVFRAGSPGEWKLTETPAGMFWTSQTLGPDAAVPWNATNAATPQQAAALYAQRMYGTSDESAATAPVAGVSPSQAAQTDLTDSVSPQAIGEVGTPPDGVDQGVIGSENLPLSQQPAHITAKTAAEQRPEDIKAARSAMNQAQEMIYNINQLLEDPGFDAIYGGVDVFGVEMPVWPFAPESFSAASGSPAASAESKREMASGQAFLAGRGKLANTGQISDFESKKAEKAMLRAQNTRLSDADAREAWEEARDWIRAGVLRAYDQTPENFPGMSREDVSRMVPGDDRFVDLSRAPDSAPTAPAAQTLSDEDIANMTPEELDAKIRELEGN